MLAKQERLSKGWQYEEVLRQGRVYRHPLVTLHVWERPAASIPPARQAGFIVSKKLGRSVIRNRVKRRISEAYRLRLPQVQSGVSLVWIARPAAAAVDYWQIAAAVDALLNKAGLYRVENRDGSAGEPASDVRCAPAINDTRSVTAGDSSDPVSGLSSRC